MVGILKLSMGDNPHGYHVEFAADGQVIERDTYVCQHCGGLKQVYAESVRVKCRRCRGDVGECCAHKGVCHPQTNPNRWELMEQIERNYDFRRQLEKLGI